MILACLAGVFLAIALANVFFWPKVGNSRPASKASVAILIPARDEEDNLPACLASAIATGAVEILVYDDHSSDGTAGIVRAFAAGDARVRIVNPSPLPPGWAGKTFACHTLSRHASADWLVFLDADTRLAPGAPALIVAEAEDRGVTFLSCWPGIEMQSFAERALMPMLNFLVFSLFPGPLSLYVNSPNLGIAHGACILTHRETYRRLGGHEMVRGEIFEDTRLAQAWRAAGERGVCVDGSDLVQVRMYRDFTGIWNGFQKNFYPAFRRPFMFFGFVLLHAAVFLTPFLAAPFLAAPFLSAAWIAALIVLATRAAIALRFRHPLWSVLLHPLAEAFLIALGFVSFWRCASHRGVQWKGRMYRTIT
jgi:glycosyltransferase involved in cell wall biosynthesis